MRIPPPSVSRMVDCFTSCIPVGRAVAVSVRHAFSALIRRVAETHVRRSGPGWSRVAVFVLIITGWSKAAGTLNLEFTGKEASAPLERQPVLDGGANGKLTLMRLDFLLTGLALQRTDGTWVEASKDWAAFLSVGKQQLTAQSDGVAEGDYQAIRFRIGVPPETDRIDPSVYPPTHPLHPDVCGLHWGWQGGYIYMAAEGQSSRSLKGGNGFSFHLAREGNSPVIELPVSFRGGGPVTLHIGMDVESILKGIDFSRDGNASHSRDGDPIPAKMNANLTKSFRVLAVKSDLFQSAREREVPAQQVLPAGTTVFPLEITSRFPKETLPQDNPLTAQGVALGDRLFHENRLSVNDSISCSTCHQQATGFSDSRKFSIGAEGHLGKRRSMPLVNLAWQKSFFWDGRAPTLREQVLMPIRDPHEMNEKPEAVAEKLGKDPVYQKLFSAAFGSPEVTPDRMALALEQFLLTKVSQESRFDLALRKAGELTETEKRGLQLFVTEHAPERGLRGADCFHCHGGMLFTDHEFHDNGLDLEKSDIGRMTVTGNEVDRGKFKTPSLRNVALRAPYMHDGRFATLEEVVEHYNSGVHRRPNLDPNLAKHPAAGLGLTDQEKGELVAFLRTLTDTGFSTSPPQTSNQP